MRRKTKFIILIILILLLWLLFSNKIIGTFWNTTHGITIENINYNNLKSNESNEVKAAVDFYYKTNDVLDVFAINGWRLKTDTKSESIKETFIILHSDKVSYKVSCDSYERDEKSLAGYGTEFSMLGAKKGIYNIELYFSDDGINYNIFPTNYYISVNNKGSEVWKFKSQIIKIKSIDAKICQSIKYDPGIQVNEDNILFWSWAFIDGQDTTNQEIVISLEDESGNETFYTTKQIKRTGVAEAFNNQGYEMSGFMGEIPGENMDEKAWKIRFYIKHGDNWYQPPSYFYYDKSSTNISEFQPKLNNLQNISSSVNQFIKYESGIKFFKDKITFGGWAFIEGSDCSDQEIVISLENESGNEVFYSTRKTERDDVAEVYNNQNYISSGFMCEIPGESMNEKDWIIRFYIKLDNNWYQPTSYLFYTKNNAKINKIQTKLDANLQINSSINFSINCDPGIHLYEDLITFWSWAFIEGQDTTNQKIVISLEDESGNVSFYSTTQTERTDVADVYRNSDYSMAGFTANIRVENVKQTNWKIRFYIQNEDYWYQQPQYLYYDKNNDTINYVNE